MSSKAIAAITYILQQIVEESISNQGIDSLGIKFFTKPLDRVEEDIDIDDNALNLYLYRVSENEGWKNKDLVNSNTSSKLASNAYLALDLYYILSTHGSGSYNSELMLGAAMVAFHNNSIVGRQSMANILATVPILANSELSEHIQQLKISPLFPDTEEISKIWAMFGAKHRLSVYYKVSTALLVQEQEVIPPLPVQEK